MPRPNDAHGPGCREAVELLVAYVSRISVTSLSPNTAENSPRVARYLVIVLGMDHLSGGYDKPTAYPSSAVSHSAGLTDTGGGLSEGSQSSRKTGDVG